MILYVETDAIHGELLNTLNWIQFIGSERSYHLLYTHMISIETELMVYQSISIDRLWGTLDENQLQ